VAVWCDFDVVILLDFCDTVNWRSGHWHSGDDEFASVLQRSRKTRPWIA